MTEAIRKDDTDRPGSSIEIKECISLLRAYIRNKRIESLSSSRIRLEETLWLYLEGLPEEYLSDTRFPEKEDWIPSDDISSTRILEEIYRGNVWKVFLEICQKSLEFLSLSRIPLRSRCIHTENEHDLVLKRFPHDQMTEKTFTGFRIIRRES
jgi:hypothetical protein